MISSPSPNGARARDSAMAVGSPTQEIQRVTVGSPSDVVDTMWRAASSDVPVSIVAPCNIEAASGSSQPTSSFVSLDAVAADAE